jgi:hypothetical protein
MRSLRKNGERRRMYVLYECERMNVLVLYLLENIKITQEVASRDMKILLCLISISNLKTGRFEAFISMNVLKPDVLKPDVLQT